MQVKRKKGTQIICVLLLLIGSLFYYQTYLFPKEMGPVASEYGSAFFPRVLLIFIAATTVALLVQSTLRRRGDAEENIVSMGKGQLGRCLGLWLLCMAFYLAWKNFDYLYAAPLFMMATGWLMAARSIAVLAFLAALGPLMYVVFEKLLKVGL
jgi:hypothetical protein